MNIKEPKNYKEQIEILKSRNIAIDDEDDAIAFLKNVNYYRATGYLLPFKVKGENESYNGVNFKTIEAIYNFDGELRNIIWSAVGTIEVSLRANIAYYHANKHGAEAYKEESNYNQHHNHEKFMETIDKYIEDHKKNPVVVHHIKEYEGHFPIWVIIEFFTTGALSRFYCDLLNPDKAHLAKELYGTNYQTMDSWVHCLTILRNRCAHYSRIYYWKFPTLPKLPGDLEKYKSNRLFTQVLMLKLMYPNKEEWNDKVYSKICNLINKYEHDVDLNHLDFPDNWEEILENN